MSDEQADEDTESGYCRTHEVSVDDLPAGFDRCPYCQLEEDRDAQLRHEMTRDPTLEPY